MSKGKPCRTSNGCDAGGSTREFMHEEGQSGPKVCDPTKRMKPQSDSALQSHDGQGPIGGAGEQAGGLPGTSTILTSTSTSPTLPKQKVLIPIPKAKGIDNVKKQVRAET